MRKDEIIITIITVIIGSSALNGVITHLLYSNKLKKEWRAQKYSMVSQKIVESLFYVRNVVLELGTIEIFDVENTLEEKGSQIDMFGGECIYPSIFNNWDSYDEFKSKISECRNEHEKYLSCRVALNIVFIDRYLDQLKIFMSEFGNEELLPFFGTIFIFDLHAWQMKMDKLLVKEINKGSYELESHETKKWRKLRKKEVEKQYENTILHHLLTGNYKRRDKYKMELVKLQLSLLVPQEVKEDNE